MTREISLRSSGLEQRSMMSFDFLSIFVFGNTEISCSCLIKEDEISEPDEIVMIDCWPRPEDQHWVGGVGPE